MMPERFADRGTLVYDMATDTWLRTQSIDLVGYDVISFADGIIHAVSHPGGVVWDIDLSVLPLVPAEPLTPSGPF
jgi:hypothetical protein